MPDPARHLRSQWAGDGSDIVQRPGRNFLCGVLIVVAGIAAYANSFAGAFLLDDLVHVLGNLRIRQLSPINEVVRDSSRPLVDLSLALNWAIGGRNPAGYHVFNLFVHILAALALFGLVRRCLAARSVNSPPAATVARRKSEAADNPPAQPGAEGGGIALVVALVWVVHPLTTQSVTYVIQRAESMAALFYLLTLYCVVRGAGTRGLAWKVGAVAACAAGMLCKPVLITAPFVALLMDRALLAKSWPEAFARRWGMYAALAATWLIAAWLGLFGEVADADSHVAGTVGFNIPDLTPWQYLLSQGGVILHYLRLCYWPHPLVFDYAWPVSDSAAQALPAGLAVLAMLAASLRTYARRPALGLPALAFFIILAPTSSFVPVADLCVEHRMYLPLACVIAVTAICVARLLRRLKQSSVIAPGTVRFIAAGSSAIIVIALAARTHGRNRDYHSELTMWRSVVAARPDNARARAYYGTALLDAEQTAEGIEQLRAALRIDDNLDVVRNNLANGLAQAGRNEEAVALYLEILARQPALTHVHFNLGLVLQRIGRLDEAAAHYAAGLSADPDQIGPRINRARCLGALGRTKEAAADYQEALRLDPQNREARDGLAALRLPPAR